MAEEIEDLEKYIFDPQNPKGCKVYNLLLKIVKEGNNIAYISPSFFLQIFEDQLFDQKTINELWDKPQNFTKLTILEKIEVYKKNFSIRDFVLEQKKKNILLKPHKLSTLFTSFFEIKSTISPELTRKPKTIYELISSEKINIGNIDDDLVNYISDDEYHYLTPKELKGSIIIRPSVFFLGEERYIFFEGINFDYASILIATLDDYKFHCNLNDKTNLKPLLLKDIKDVNYLLEVLYQDVQEIKRKEQYKEELVHPIHEVHIQNFFSIENIQFSDLHKHHEIYLVGENGDGKTSVLQAITLALKGNQQEGKILDFLKENFREDMQLTAIDNKKGKYKYDTKAENSYKNLFAYGVNRGRNDSDQKDDSGYLTLFNSDQYLDNPVKWLQHLDYKQAKGEDAGIGLETAKSLLKSILDENVEIEVTTDDVWFIERGTKLRFNQLSEGYRSVIIWVSDLVKRLSENQPYALKTEDFRGIVLVDEIELHLHPKWKFRIVSDLRKWFPKIQFFFTTHSPTVLLGASKDAVFYKVYKENGMTKISEPIKDLSHLSANSLITSPLFGLETAVAKSGGETAIQNASSDDYVYQKIHEVITRKIQETPDIVDADVMRMVEEELAKLENPKP